MEVNEQIKNFKDLVNSYKVTSIIIAAKEIGLFNILTNNKISVEEIAKRLKLERDRIEPILAHFSNEYPHVNPYRKPEAK